MRFLLTSAFVLFLLQACSGQSSSKVEKTAASYGSEEKSASVSKDGVKLAKTFLVSDFENYLRERTSAASIDWSRFWGVQRSTTANEYYRSYRENEISADDGYKNKIVAVRGVVESINKAFDGKAYLKLSVPNSFSGVMAYLNESEVGNAAKLKKGTKVGMLCVGGGMMMSTPILNDCLGEYSYIESKKNMIESAVDDAFSGKQININDDSGHLRAFMLVGYYTALRDKNNACGADPKYCAVIIQESIKSLQDQTKAGKFDDDVIKTAKILNIDAKTLSFNKEQ